MLCVVRIWVWAEVSAVYFQPRSWKCDQVVALRYHPSEGCKGGRMCVFLQCCVHSSCSEKVCVPEQLLPVRSSNLSRSEGYECQIDAAECFATHKIHTFFSLYVWAAFSGVCVVISAYIFRLTGLTQRLTRFLQYSHKKLDIKCCERTQISLKIHDSWGIHLLSS